MHRFTDTEKWNEDWYCDLGGQYQLLWDYICDRCDNAGVWKPNKNDFEGKTGYKVGFDEFLPLVNEGKERIYILSNKRWFITGFIKYQWFNKKSSFSFNPQNKLHASLIKILSANSVPLEKVRGFIGFEVTKKEDPLPEVLQDPLADPLEEVLPEVFEGVLPDHRKTIGRPSEEVKGKGKGIVIVNTESIGDSIDNAIDTEGLIIMLGGEEFLLAKDRPQHAPAPIQVFQYFNGQRKTVQDAKAFFDYYEGLSWKKGITPISNWASFANTWIANSQNFKPFNNGTTTANNNPKGHQNIDAKSAYEKLSMLNPQNGDSGNQGGR